MLQYSVGPLTNPPFRAIVVYRKMTQETKPGSISLEEAIGQLRRLPPETRNLVVSLIGRLAQSEGGLDHPDRSLPIPPVVESRGTPSRSATGDYRFGPGSALYPLQCALQPEARLME